MVEQAVNSLPSIEVDSVVSPAFSKKRSDAVEER